MGGYVHRLRAFQRCPSPMCKPLLWTTTLLLLLNCTQVHSSGIFEIALKSFKNEYGHDVNSNCCETDYGPKGEEKGSEHCTRSCRTYFIICLKEFRREIDLESNCTYGWYKSPVVESNSFNSTSSEGAKHFATPIAFNFSFSWPGDFSLIVEAWHDSTSFSRLGKKHEDKLIMRLATQSSLRVGEHWTNNVSRTDQTTLRYSYRAVCEKTYYGEDCGTLCKPRNDQFGHYTCNATSGARICLPGWTSEYCTKPICLPGCRHGDCKRPNQCNCKYGWKGPLCDQCLVYPGCHHGSCGQKPWECVCDEGWGGLLCNQDLNYCTNHKPCKNGGICENTGKGFYTCKCPLGFTGANCETPVNNCAQQPCANGGTCKTISSSNYTCDCPLGFTGKHCETLASTCTENPCQRGGSCVNGPSGYLCVCRPGYKGNDCEIEQTDCDPNPCSNGGNCVKNGNGYECQCRAGFDGPNCERNINDCAENPCLNGATCVDEVNTFRCECVPGFVGSVCETNVDDCLARPCANGGSCIDQVNAYQCTCAPGFTGSDCSINIDDCASNPCVNGGTCVDRVDEYQCECLTGYFGRRCESNENHTSDIVGGVGVSGESATISSVKVLLQTPIETNFVNEQASSASGLSNNDLSPEKVALISFASAIVPVMVIVAVCVILLFKRRRYRKERRRREDEDEVRWQNEQNSANLQANRKKCLENGAKVIVNTLDKAPSLYHLNRQKSATLSKLTNEDYDSSLLYARQVAVANENNKSASLLRTKSNNKLVNVNTDCSASNFKRPISKVIIDRENKPKSYSLHPEVMERRDSLTHLNSVPNPSLNSESSMSNSSSTIHSLARAQDRDSHNNNNNNNNNNSHQQQHHHQHHHQQQQHHQNLMKQQPSRSSGRSINSVYVIDDQIYSQPAFVDPQQKLFATQV